MEPLERENEQKYILKILSVCTQQHLVSGLRLTTPLHGHDTPPNVPGMIKEERPHEDIRLRVAKLVDMVDEDEN